MSVSACLCLRVYVYACVCIHGDYRPYMIAVTVERRVGKLPSHKRLTDEGVLSRFAFRHPTLLLVEQVEFADVWDAA